MIPVSRILQGMNPGELDRLKHVVNYDFDEKVTIGELRKAILAEQDRKAVEELDKDAIRNFLSQTTNLDQRVSRLYEAGFRVPEPTKEADYIPEIDPY